MAAGEEIPPQLKLPELVARLETLRKREGVAEDYVRFRIALLEAQHTARDALARRPPAAPAAAPLSAQSVPFEDRLLASCFAGLRTAAARAGSEPAEVSRLAEAAESEPELLAELAAKSAFGPDEAYLESLSGRLEVSTDGLLFFGRALAAPFVTHAAERIPPERRVADATSTTGHCACCGSPPGLASLRRDDGQRTLYCPLCGAHRRFVRLACPYCGHRDRAGLTFLRGGADDPHWLETCAACGAYIKTVDLRKLPAGRPLVPLVEDTATLHLDLLAEREGCRRRLPYVALH